MFSGNKAVIALLASLVLLALLLVRLSFVLGQSANAPVMEWEQYYTEGYANDAIKFIVETPDDGYAFAAPRNHYSLYDSAEYLFI